MKASTLEQYHTEWRVNFEMSKPFIDEHASHDRLLDWIVLNVGGQIGKDWRISALAWHAAFLREDDALLCFLAFQ